MTRSATQEDWDNFKKTVQYETAMKLLGSHPATGSAMIIAYQEGYRKGFEDAINLDEKEEG